jgi:NADH:ubiquinone oxidoreductase subunit D
MKFAGTAVETPTESAQARRTRWTIGPFSPLLPGAYRAELLLDGEVVESARAEGGFTSRGVETVLTRHSWRGVIPVLDRIDPNAAVFYEWAYCLALEEIAAIEVPPRARGVRIILAELTRISCHLLHLSRVSRAAGSDAAFHLLTRERERVLDLLELLCGSRHAVCFLTPSGVREDVTDGFLERVQEVCQQLTLRLKEYNDLITYNEAFIRRVAGRGVIGRGLVLKHGITGIPARVFDAGKDSRWASERMAYGALRPEAPIVVEPHAAAGDIHHRFVLRLDEIAQSARILSELSQRLPAGAHRLRAVNETLVAEGECGVMVETARGVLELQLRADGERRGPTSMRFGTPSQPLFAAMPEYLVGAPIQDLSLMLESLDLQITEVDK